MLRGDRRAAQVAVLERLLALARRAARHPLQRRPRVGSCRRSERDARDLRRAPDEQRHGLEVALGRVEPAAGVADVVARAAAHAAQLGAGERRAGERPPHAGHPGR